MADDQHWCGTPASRVSAKAHVALAHLEHIINGQQVKAGVVSNNTICLVTTHYVNRTTMLTLENAVNTKENSIYSYNFTNSTNQRAAKYSRAH